ncbi:GGDEF domain-containing protein [Azorhizobium caulinodans]|nr:GGDEF domain-containing protein [Azorhizobium caulinodans]
MFLDPATLFCALGLTMTVSGTALLWSWRSDRSEGLLAWAGSGLLVASLGLVISGGFLGPTGRLANALGSTIVLLAVSFIWAGARAFNHRPLPWRIMAAILIAWIAIWATPVFDIWPRYRSLVGSGFIGLFLGLATFELRRGEPYSARVPLVALMGVHTVVVLVRIPVLLGFLPNGMVPSDSPWISLVVLEGMIAIQTLAILVLALAKERLELRLRHAADTDFLTGLFNRRAFFAQGGQQAEACRLARHPYSVVIFDLDDFKQVNDGYGHPAGDAVLRAFALAARECLSPEDVAGRLGGEEFALVLPGLDGRAAVSTARRVLDRFTHHARAATPHNLCCTASGGVAASRLGQATVEVLLNDADLALYEAKREGDNVLRLSSERGGFAPSRGPTRSTGTRDA